LVSAIIPARNEEASIARCVESLALQPEIEEIIVVNDQSTDQTASILSELSERIPQLIVMEAGAIPEGWAGKNYAVSVGAAAAKGEWLLFTDADTYHYPGAMRRALTDAVDHDAVMVSYSPEQEMETWWERAMIPYVYCRLAARFSFERVSNPKLPDAAANGQFLMILRDVYNAVGGHAEVAGELLEDVALARLVKASGYTIYFAAPIGVVRTRMYRTFGAMWEGWTKNLYRLAGGNVRALFAELRIMEMAAGAGLLALWVFLLRGRFGGIETLFAGLLIALILAHMRYGALLYRNLYPVSFIKYYVAGACLYRAALIASWWKNAHGTVIWKGRAYPRRAS
jgi:glycosyltransferase involved in cell wall biosynthesis